VQEVTDFLHTKSEDYEFEAVEYSLTRIREKQEQEKEDKRQRDALLQTLTPEQRRLLGYK
jgi:FixJ family two-component response regulator